RRDKRGDAVVAWNRPVKIVRQGAPCRRVNILGLEMRAVGNHIRVISLKQMPAYIADVVGRDNRTETQITLNTETVAINTGNNVILLIRNGPGRKHQSWAQQEGIHVAIEELGGIFPRRAVHCVSNVSAV